MSRFIEVTDQNLVTMAINLDHVTAITLSHARPPMPLASIVLNDGSLIPNIRLASFPLDSVNAQLNEQNARNAIDRFFAMVCERRPDPTMLPNPF